MTRPMPLYYARADFRSLIYFLFRFSDYRFARQNLLAHLAYRCLPFHDTDTWLHAQARPNLLATLRAPRNNALR